MRQKTGLFWHVHHEILVEYCYNYSGRVRHIRTTKPAEEIKLRLRLFKPVKGAPKEVVKAYQVFNRVLKAYTKANIAYQMLWLAFFRTPIANNTKANQALNKEGRAYTKAAARVLSKVTYDHRLAQRLLYKTLAKHMPAIEALHKKECPDCPWNGRTIFPE